MEGKTEDIKLLYRSQNDRLIAGICGGLAEYLNMDSTVVRLVFIILLFFGGSGFLIYIVMWIFVPEEKLKIKSHHQVFEENIAEIKSVAQHMQKSVQNEKLYNARLWVAVVLILTGIVFLLNNFGLFYIDVGKLWPVWIILVGLLLILKE